MPWCPKCKTEYIEGVEICVDCHTPLVESLTAPQKGKNCPLPKEDIADEEKVAKEISSEISADISEETPAEVMQAMAAQALRSRSVTYVRPQDQYSETKSSGYMLIIIGAAGLIALILIVLKIIPLSMDPIMQYVFYAVMAVLFGAFLFTGLNALKKTAQLKSKIAETNTKESELLAWLADDAQKKQLDQCHDSLQEPEEQFFICQEMMRTMLMQKDSELTEDFLEYLIEQAYNQFYE